MNILLLADELDESLHQMEVYRNRRRGRRLARETFEPFNDLMDAEFVKTFRLQKSFTRSLVQELTPFIPQPRRSDGLSVALKVLISSAFYSSGSYQTLVGQSTIHNVSPKSVPRPVRQVTEALNLIYANHFKWPTQQDQEFIQEYIMTGEIHQENLADQQNQRVNPDLVAEWVLQQALLEKLWQDRRYEPTREYN